MHAIPASDAMEYEGMPAFAETGVLVMDSKVEATVESILEGSPQDISFVVEHMSPTLSFKLEELEEKEEMEKVKLPAKCSARVDEGTLKIKVEGKETLSYEIDQHYPHI